MVEGWENKSEKNIRHAIDMTLATGEFSIAAEILNKYLKAQNNEINQKDLQKEFGPGILSLQFGSFCRAVAKELGDLTPRAYALTNLRIEGNARFRSLKPCVVRAMLG